MGTAHANANSNEFIVKFSSSSSDSEAYSSCLSSNGTITDCAEIYDLSVVSDRVATFDIRGLQGYGDTATIKFKILNESTNGSSASLSVSATTNTNSEYFDLSTELSQSTIAPNQYSILTIKIKVKKVLYTSITQSTNVTVTVTPTEI